MCLLSLKAGVLSRCLELYKYEMKQRFRSRHRPKEVLDPSSYHLPPELQREEFVFKKPKSKRLITETDGQIRKEA